MEKKICLTIAGSDSGGGAGIQADLKTFAALGVHGTSAVTALTAQNTMGVRSVHNSPLDFIKDQLETLHNDFNISAAKTGMLSSKEIIRTVIENLGDYPLVVDPVMVATSGASLLDEDAIDIIKKKLIPRAIVVTPNIPEARVLSGIKIENQEDMEEAARIIGDMGASVIVKGGHGHCCRATDVLLYNDEIFSFSGPLFKGETHGSGCTFASAITAHIARGKTLPEAVGSAKEFVTEAIRTAYVLGNGPKIVNPVDAIYIDSQRFRVVNEIKANLDRILKEPNFHMLVPEVGINMAYSIEDPKSFHDLAGIKGRIVRAGDEAVRVGDIEFGASRHVAKIVLAAMNLDANKRCAMNIRYSRGTLDRAKELNMTISFFSRENEPEDVSTMEWGTTQAIEKIGYVPDLIYDEGGIGKEPMIRLLGENPESVKKKVLMILEKTD